MIKRSICFALIGVILAFSVSACNSDTGKTVGLSLKNLTGEERERMKTMNSPYLSNFGGLTGERVKGNKEQWLYSAIESNPLMLDAIRRRNAKPRLSIVSWFGQFPGAFLLSAASSYKIDRDQRLYEVIEEMVEELAELQGEDGYLGPFPDGDKLDGYASAKQDTGKVWDIGGHHFMMMGLIEWYEATGSQKALDICNKIADMLYDYRFEQGRSIADNTMNQTLIILPFAKLYGITNNPKHLQFIKEVENYWSGPFGGDYLESGYRDMEFSYLRHHRWEHAFDVQALGEMYKFNGDEKYKTALENLWWSILKGDRHPNGGFTADEAAAGSPYMPGANETCASIAWEALTLTYYELTRNPYAIDELELTTMNAIFGAQNPSGRWWTYDTPLTGYRKSSTQELVWQALPGAPEFNCCQSNSARGIGLLNRWGVYREDGQLYVNYYGESEFVTATPGGNPLMLVQESRYPSDGAVKITLDLEKSEKFSLSLRIPAWSEDTRIKLNGEELDKPNAGGYYNLTKTWKTGDVIELELDLSLHYWALDDRLAGSAAIYSGPVLLSMDKRFNPGIPAGDIEIDLENLALKKLESGKNTAPMVLYSIQDAKGREICLSDFATAGANGTYYTSVFRTDQLRVIPYSEGKKEIIWLQRFN